LQHLAQKALAVEFTEVDRRARRVLLHEFNDAGAHKVRLGAAQYAAFTWLDRHERHFKVAQGTQLMGKHVVHRHPRDHAHHGQRRQYHPLHQHVGAPREDADDHGLRIATGQPQGLGIRKRLTGGQALEGAGDDIAVQVQHKQLTAMQARLELLQGALYKRRAAIDGRLTKIRVIGQPVEAVLDTPPAQIHKPLEHPGTGLELLLRLIAGHGNGHGFNGEVHRTDNQQQEQGKEQADTRLKTVAQLHAAPSIH